MEWPLIIFVLAVIVISLGYWWYRQKGIKSGMENKEEVSKETEE